MNESSSIQEPAVAQARAAAYTLIASGFQYPDPALIEALADPRKWKHWPEVLQKDYGRLGELLESVRHAVRTEAEDLADGSNGEPRELQHHHDDLFGHAVRGRCPAYEMEYGRHEIIRQAADLADLAGFYRAFGLQFADGANGRPDHITVECEFMSTLCAKEAHAQAVNDEENVEVCVNAERAFLKDHLAQWLPAFTHRVVEADSEGLYSTIARFAEAFVQAECEHFDIRPGPQTLELGAADPVLDREIACGSVECGPGQSDGSVVQLNVDPEL